MLAEYRPALSDAGAAGAEAEIFFYDTLPGGAGFSQQLAPRSSELLKCALGVLENCPANCDASCYRCLRSFWNKLDHHILDRKLARHLLRHLIEGGIPDLDERRVRSSTEVLFSELKRQSDGRFEFSRDLAPATGSTSPIRAVRKGNGATTLLVLFSSIAPHVPAQKSFHAALESSANIVCIDDLIVRKHLPAAVDRARESFRQGVTMQAGEDGCAGMAARIRGRLWRQGDKFADHQTQMRKTIKQSLNKFGIIPHTLRIAPMTNAPVSEMYVDPARLYHHYYLDTRGFALPSPDPAQFEHLGLLLPCVEFRTRGPGFGIGTAFRQHRSNELGQVFLPLVLVRTSEHYVLRPHGSGARSIASSWLW